LKCGEPVEDFWKTLGKCKAHAGLCQITAYSKASQLTAPCSKVDDLLWLYTDNVWDDIKQSQKRVSLQSQKQAIALNKYVYQHVAISQQLSK
jgi:hypothetical protein